MAIGVVRAFCSVYVYVYVCVCKCNVLRTLCITTAAFASAVALIEIGQLSIEENPTVVQHQRGANTGTQQEGPGAREAQNARTSEP